MKQITLDTLREALDSTRKPYQEKYLAMYSGLLKGLVTDPVLMFMPMDDHLVHRGDGVFDSCKSVDGALYNLDAHLDRLYRSAAAVGLSIPMSREALVETVVETVRAAGVRDSSVRILVSRGPGSFSCNPYDCSESTLYVIVTAAGTPFMELKPEGATVAISAIPAKPPFFAGVKSCNYLPNVLMKRESVDSGVDFVIGLDQQGFLAEGPTENVGIVTTDGELVFPRLESILCGTTMMRAVELAQAAACGDGPLRGVSFRDISIEEARGAAEMLIVGTTPNVARSACLMVL